MANGRLGVGVSVAGSDVQIYQVPASGVLFATVSINIVNKGVASGKVRVALSLNATPDLADYIEFDTEIAENGGILERACKLLSPGERVIIHADTNDFSIRVEGLEKTTT